MDTNLETTNSEHGHWYKKISDFKEYDENPFLEQAVLEMKTSIKRKTIRPKKGSGNANLMVVDNAGELHGSASFMNQVEVDEETFTKIYRKGTIQFLGLSTRGSKVLAYVFDELKPGVTTIHFMFTKAIAHTGYKTKANVLSGMAELIEGGIIARSREPSLYFINPGYMFNGSRLTFAKTFVKKQIEARTGEQLNLGFDPTLIHLKEMLGN